MKLMHAIKYAYRHTWRSNRLGFFSMIPQGVEVYQAQDELKLLTFTTVCVAVTMGVLINFEWIPLN